MSILLTILTILSSFLTNLEQKTLQSNFTITVAEEVNAPMNYPGQITMHGKQFALTMFGVEAAYDGKTLYMYNADMDELSLSNPSEQELLEANPFLYAKALVDVCNITERTTADGKQVIVTLTPKDQSIGINRFTLRIRKADLMPLQVELREGQKNTTLKLANPTYITTQQTYTITPEASTYINDMRF